MDKTIHHNHPIIRRIYLYLFLVTWLLLLTALIVYLFISQQQLSQQVSNQQPPYATNQAMHKTTGSMTLSLKDNSTNTVSVGQSFTLQVRGASEGKDVVGFDAILNYDQSAFTFQSASSSLAGFKVFSFARGDHETFTAIKAPEVQTPTPLDQTVMLSTVFTPNQKGTYTFSLAAKSNKETTKMVDVQTKILNPSIQNLQVVVN